MLLQKEQMRRDPNLFLCRIQISRNKIAEVIQWCEREKILFSAETSTEVSIVCTEPQLMFAMLKFSGGTNRAV